MNKNTVLKAFASYHATDNQVVRDVIAAYLLHLALDTKPTVGRFAVYINTSDTLGGKSVKQSRRDLIVIHFESLGKFAGQINVPVHVFNPAAIARIYKHVFKTKRVQSHENYEGKSYGFFPIPATFSRQLVADILTGPDVVKICSYLRKKDADKRIALTLL